MIYSATGLAILAAIAIYFYRQKPRKYRQKNSDHEALGLSNSTDATISASDISLTPDNPQIASSFFCGPEGYNCAQAILRTYQKRFSIPDRDIIAARKKGYGKVPGGLCGALYAGRLLLDDEHKSQQLTRDFESRAGSARCKQILHLKCLSCKECVALTARLLDSLFT